MRTLSLTILSLLLKNAVFAGIVGFITLQAKWLLQQIVSDKALRLSSNSASAEFG
jgi:hypothetical protein